MRGWAHWIKGAFSSANPLLKSHESIPPNHEKLITAEWFSAKYWAEYWNLNDIQPTIVFAFAFQSLQDVLALCFEGVPYNVEG